MVGMQNLVAVAAIRMPILDRVRSSDANAEPGHGDMPLLLDGLSSLWKPKGVFFFPQGEVLSLWKPKGVFFCLKEKPKRRSSYGGEF